VKACPEELAVLLADRLWVLHRRLGGPGAGLGEGEGERGEGQHLDVAPLLQGEHEAAISDDGAVGELLLNLSVS
jgi:hypothetical protein